ncbi:MAG: glucuronate isomerase [Planctomycetota bacterium]
MSNQTRCHPGTSRRDDAWLLHSDLASAIFEAIADLPVRDYHCHLDPVRLASDRPFTSLDELWIAGDPYKHRTMRMLGIDEALISGEAEPRDRLRAWLACLPGLLGSPLHDWGRLEFQRTFGIDTDLNPADADRLADQVAERLADDAYRPMALLHAAGVESLCTSDAWLDDLSPHEQRTRRNDLAVLPSLRADAALTVGTEAGREFVAALANATDRDIHEFGDFVAALGDRLDRFEALGTCVVDHGLDTVPPRTAHAPCAAEPLFDRWWAGGLLTDVEHQAITIELLAWLAEQYRRREWTLLLHLGAQRETSSRLRRLAGPSGGYAAMRRPIDLDALTALLDRFERQDALPRTVLFNLNPADNAALATLCGSYTADGEAGYVSFGPAWWYNDHRRGIEAHLEATADYALLANFPGMASDSRSFLSMHRHEYFRRVLCRWLAVQAEQARLPDDAETLGQFAKRLAHDNPMRLMPNRPTAAIQNKEHA